MKNWIAISREIEYHWIWQNPRQFQWWMQLLFLAAWDNSKVVQIGNTQIRLRRAQVCCSLRSLSRKWMCTKQTTITFLRMLEFNGMIKRRKMNKFSIITILNYDKFQTPGFNENKGSAEGSKFNDDRRGQKSDFSKKLDHFDDFYSDEPEIIELAPKRSKKKMNKKKGKKAEKDRKNNHVSTSKSDASLDHFLDHNINNITNNIIPINALAREKRDFQGDDDLKKNNQGLDHFDNADINPDSLTGNQNQDQKGPAARELENSQKNPEQLDHFENPQNTGQLDHFENPQNSDRLDHFGNPKNSDRLDHFDDGLIKAKEAGLFQLLRSSQKFREDCAAMFGIEPNEVAARIDSFEVECRARGHQHQFLKDLRSHFVNWLRIALRCEKQVKEKYDKNQTRNIKSYDNGNDIRQSNATSQFENRRGSDVGLHTEADFLPPF